MQIIVGMLIAAVLFGGGFLTGRASKTTEQIEYVDIENRTEIQVRQENSQKAFQGQITVILDDGGTNRFVNVNMFDATNFIITFETNTNSTTSLTNRRTIRQTLRQSGISTLADSSITGNIMNTNDGR